MKAALAEVMRFNGLTADIPKPPFSSRTAGVLRHVMTRYFEEGRFPDVQALDYTLDCIKHNFAHKISTRARR